MHHLVLQLEVRLRFGWESLLWIGGAAMRHVPGLLAIEALAFFGELVSFLRCELLKSGINGVCLHFCCIHIYRNIL